MSPQSIDRLQSDYYIYIYVYIHHASLYEMERRRESSNKARISQNYQPWGWVVNRRAAEERLRLEGAATPDITSAAYATLPKMGTRDASRAGHRLCPRESFAWRCLRIGHATNQEISIAPMSESQAEGG